MTYNGFCRALAELPEEDLLVAGLGRGWVEAENVRCLVSSPDGALLFFPLVGGAAKDSRQAPPADLGVTALDIAQQTALKGCIVVAFESGRIRLTNRAFKGWAASICIPDSTLAVRFDSAAVQVVDDGAGYAHWPTLHEFTLHFPIHGPAIERCEVCP
jgi:hypothetical protein